MKLRRYHRWLAPLFAVFLLWIAVTGVTIQFIKLSTPARSGPPPAAASAPGPESETDRIRRERHDLSEFVMDLHSGKAFRPLGTWLSILSGVVLLFLAGSGLWMYVKMFRARTRDGRTPSGGKYFW